MNRIIYMLLCLFPGLLAAQVVVDYVVRVEEKVTPEQLAALPVRVLIGTNGNRVMVRGVWETPRKSYQLYLPGEDVFYHCALDGNIAVKYDFRPTADVLMTMAPEENIAGLSCKKAIAIEGADTFPVFYTDAFGINFCQIAQIPGFAMRYTKRLQGVKVTYEAVDYRFETIPDNVFSLGGKKIVENENFADSRQWAMRIGRKAPKIKTTLLDGSSFGPKDYKGKVLVVDFNNYDPPPAHLRAMAWFDAYARDYAAHPDVIFLAVLLNRETGLLRSVALEDRLFLVAPDGAFDIEAFRLNTLPSTVVINRDGKITEYIEGHPAGVEPRLRRAIDLALSGGLKPAGIK